MPRGRPRKHVTKAEQLEANRSKVQQHRRRQKEEQEEEENDTAVIQHDDTAGLLQSNENEEVEKVVEDLQEDLDPHDLYCSSPKATTQSQSNKKDDDDDTIQKTIADFSTIRLDSVSPVKSIRRRKPTIIPVAFGVQKRWHRPPGGLCTLL
ncbi:MAG: hypothetical protein M1839_005301 [Geoglossum umbratile]|nr:MAG: hypothetical protein M1839_005301 [Geoglossum umbratile]